MRTTKQTIKSTCCYCGVGCGVEVTRHRDGRLSIEGDPDHPVNRGMLCSKGRYLHHVAMDQTDRLLYPMLRHRRKETLRRVRWDEALEYTAGVFRGFIEAHGPRSVGFYVSGQLLTEEYYLANKLMKGFIGSNNIDTNSRLCMSSAVVGYKKALGDDAPPISYDDIEACDCFFIAGANPAYCHPILFRRIEARKQQNPDVKIIVVDPRRTQSCALADLHLQVQPGTDVVLFNAIAAHLIEQDLIDHDFIANHTDGFEACKASVHATTLEEAAAICKVPVDDIRQAAQWMGESPTLLTLWAMGLNQSVHGVDKNLALLNLSLLTGKIGKPGCGPFSLTGQPNAMGGREVGGLANLLACHRDLSNPQHRAEVASFWGVPSIDDKPGLTATEMVAAMERGELKALWIICTNPAVSLPDLKRLERALDACEYVVVQDISNHSDTLRFADCVLPAAAWLEKVGTMTNSERRITYLPKLIDPPGEALPDVEILCRFAEKMDWKTAFDYEDEAAIYNEYRRLSRGTTIDVAGLSHARLQAERSVQWPCPSTDHPGTDRLFANGQFWTPNGRAHLHGVTPTEAPDPPTDTFPLILTTGRTRDQWHTRTKTGKVNRLNQHQAVPMLEIHPDDAAPLGLTDGRTAQISSRHGEVTVRATLTDAIKPGTVFLPMHWGKMLGGHDGRANLATSHRVDARSKQPDYKYTAVRVERVEKTKERILVVGAGAAARNFVETYRKHNTEDEIHVFGREPNGFYNRILLPDYVGGERTWESLSTMSPEKQETLDFHLHTASEIVKIDREAKEIEDASGKRHAYDKLMLCTGSRAFVPTGVPMGWDGVFSLRTRWDADRIKRYLEPGARVLIMGGGLLGLEMAAALEHAGFQVSIIEMGERLMQRQLDATASMILEEELLDRGIDVYCGDVVMDYLGHGRIRGVLTKADRHLSCDALIVAVGTRPNIGLAVRTELHHSRGVTVNDHLQTSDPDIYAAGEIAEHHSELYGITPAAEEQAAIAAAHIAGDVWATYEGSVPFNILKIHGLDVCALGKSVVPEKEADEYEEIVLTDLRRQIYKKCVIKNDRLVGAILVGDKAEFDTFRQLIETGFELEEQRATLLGGAPGEVAEPPIGRLVCSCNRVGEGNLKKFIAEGCADLPTLCSRSRAGTGCGSCRPEVQMILEKELENLPLLTETHGDGSLETLELA